MAKERNALRAGIFMLVSLGLIIFVIIAISGASKFTESFKTYPIAFAMTDDIGGLRNGDDVRIGGLKVGDIRDIRIDQERSAVVVVIDIPAKYVLHKDAGVFIQHGLTGNAALNIDSFGTGPVLADNDYVIGQADQFQGLLHQLASLKPDIRQTVLNIKSASAKLNTDLDKLGVTADSFTSTGVNATETVQSLRVRIPEIVSRYESVVEAAVRMLDAVDLFFGKPAGNFNDTVANLKEATGQIKERLPGILDGVHRIVDHADVAVGRASDALREIQGAAANLNTASGSIRSLFVDNHSKLEGIISSLKATGDNLKAASVEIRHSPWRLLYQPKADEVANLNIYDSVRQFAEAADSLNDAAAALRDTAKDPQADPQMVKRLIAHLSDTFDRFQLVQNKLWTDIKN